MARWFKNIKTGHAWEIEDEALIRRLVASSDFEEVSAPAKAELKPAKADINPAESEPLPETTHVENEDAPKPRKKSK